MNFGKGRLFNGTEAPAHIHLNMENSILQTLPLNGRRLSAERKGLEQAGTLGQGRGAKSMPPLSLACSSGIRPELI